MSQPYDPNRAPGGYSQPYPGQSVPPAGPPPGSPMGPPPGPPLAPGDFPGKTLGVVGLIVAIFFNVIGLILSAVALSQSKKAGYRNSPALAGVVIGAVFTGISVVIIAVALVFSLTAGLTAAVFGGLSSGSGSSSQGSDGSQGSEGSPGDGGTGSDGSQDGGSASVFDLTVGDCLNDWNDGTVYDVPLVDCASPHDWEVYDDFTVPDTSDGSYPGDDKVDVAADNGCYDAYEEFVGIPYDDSQYVYSYVMPTEESWLDGDRLITCVIGHPDGPNTGTLRGAGD
ncbi:DUF4190 domain-containing protein [Herbiconiux daphne]|uniref:Septum formation family protein n=1 Tax=Herbiconiux daphne TaxID=2970914 RepID=A0ABT2H7S1_9MICO|nr:DUF4190 domain-containing protein [Herbiconiux daphne]MCS5736006.1 septum formation family protein [Herbiconiux daphne]